MGVDGELVVNGDFLNTALHECSDGEDALLGVSVLVEHLRNEVTSIRQCCHHREQVVVSNRPLLKVTHQQLPILFILGPEQTHVWVGVFGVLGQEMEVSGSFEEFEPTEVLGETSDCARVLLPTEHGLVSGETVISKDRSTSLDFLPVNGAFFDSVDVRVAVVGLLLESTLSCGLHETH